MASKTIDKNVTPLYNNVPDQRLTQAHQLTIKAWNDIINILKVQANINTEQGEINEIIYKTLKINNINLDDSSTGGKK